MQQALYPDMLSRYLHSLSDTASKKADITTFGLFDVSLHGKSIRFSSSKSKELLALLTDKAGALVPIDTTAALLWPDNPAELSKRLYRAAVIRLKLTLKQHGLTSLVFFYRAELSINRDRADCDLWRALETGDFSGYQGEYMTQYAEWANGVNTFSI